MKKLNDGIGESNILQNQFTSYLVTAVRRQKIQYIQGKNKNLKWESLQDMSEDQNEVWFEQDFFSHLPIFDQFENDLLRDALLHLKTQDLFILTRRVLDERSFQEIADEIGVGYKTVTSIYYRLLQKLRNEVGGDK